MGAHRGSRSALPKWLLLNDFLQAVQQTMVALLRVTRMGMSPRALKAAIKVVIVSLLIIRGLKRLAATVQLASLGRAEEELVGATSLSALLCKRLASTSKV